jgi:tRNA(Ile2) C34 agmatinyltransferase TiaS
MGRKTCPRCGGENITMISGGLTGMWRCKDCDYENDIFPEKEEIKKEETK